MAKLRLLLIAILTIQFSAAQYTEVINSKRPGFSDSPYSVGNDVYQVEVGGFYKNIGRYQFQIDAVTNTYSSKQYGTNVLLRVGKFIERLEVDVDLNFGYETRDYTTPDIKTVEQLGLSKFVVGAKYLVYMPEYADKSKEIRSWRKRNSFDKKRLIPAVGVYAGLNTNLLSSMHKNPDGISPRLGLFTQNNFSNKFILVGNLIADYFLTDYAQYSGILTATYSLTGNISVFGEFQGIAPKNTQFDLQFGAGGAYLFTKDFQVDASLRFIKDEYGDHTFWAGAGLSYRIDKHEDKYKLFDSKGNLTKDGSEGSFFSRLLGKNKPEKQRKVKEVKAKKRKIKTLKPSKKDKELEKKAKQQAKEDKKRQKKAAKDYDKNYEPPKKQDDNN